MRLSILGTRGIPNNYGGFEKFASDFAAFMTERGHDVTVYCSSNHPYKSKVVGKVYLVHKNFPVWMGVCASLIYDFSCLRHAVRQNLDIIMECGYTFVPWLFFFKKRIRKKIVILLDGMEWKRKKWDIASRLFIRMCEYLAVYSGCTLVSDHKAVAQYYKDVYKRNTIYLPFAVSLTFDYDDSCMEEYGIIAGTYALVIARAEPENNLEMIIRACLCASFPLVLVTDYTYGYGKKLKKKYASPNIIFTGTIYDDAKKNSLRKYAAVYLHGHSVGGTNPSLLEAMASGCSIIAHDNVFNRHILENNATYFLHTDDLADVLIGYVKEDKREKNRNNIEKIKRDYLIENVYPKYENYLREIVECNGLIKLDRNLVILK